MVVRRRLRFSQKLVREMSQEGKEELFYLHHCDRVIRKFWVLSFQNLYHVKSHHFHMKNEDSLLVYSLFFTTFHIFDIVKNFFYRNFKLFGFLDERDYIVFNKSLATHFEYFISSSFSYKHPDTSFLIQNFFLHELIDPFGNSSMIDLIVIYQLICRGSLFVLIQLFINNQVFN